MVEEHKAKLEKWFFIRYLDPDYHIRLRIKLKNQHDFSILLKGIQKEFQSYLSAGTVRDIQLAIYNREVERYPIEYIDEIEYIFSLDSSFSLRVMQDDLSPEHLYAVSVDLLIETMNGIAITVDKQIDFLSVMAKRFADEHKLSAAEYKKINSAFRAFKETYSDSLFDSFLDRYILDLSNQYSQTLKCVRKDWQTLLADIFHMHVNRLYSENQRTHELFLYEFAIQILKFRSN